MKINFTVLSAMLAVAPARAAVVKGAPLQATTFATAVAPVSVHALATPALAGALTPMSPALSIPAAPVEPTPSGDRPVIRPEDATSKELSGIERAAAADLQALGKADVSPENAASAGDHIAAALENLRTPTWDEQMKLNVASNEAFRRQAPITQDLHTTFTNNGGRVLVDRDSSANYHARASENPIENLIAMTVDAIGAQSGAVNGSWASIQALLAREQTHFYGDYKWNGQTGLPASVEKLAMAYAYMAICFAEMTNGSARAWSTNLDIREQGKSPFIWGHYSSLLEAVKQDAFIATRFYTFLRDTLARKVSENVAYQFSLYEMSTGQYYRPGTPLHEQPLPANVPRLTDAQYQQATKMVYGADGEGDLNQPTQSDNFLGFIKSWFARRGNI